MELEKQPLNTKIVTRNALLYRSYLAFVHFNVFKNGFRIGIQNIDLDFRFFVCYPPKVKRQKSDCSKS